ncbi:MAG: hypothetical protein WDN45_10820 [Caulobacteraceae bacterium]
MTALAASAAASSEGESRVVSTSRSCLGLPTSLWVSPSIQSTKYWAGAEGEAFQTLGFSARALDRCAAVMALVSTMASSTRRVRSSDFTALATGL